MKRILILGAAALSLTAVAQSSHFRSGYVRQDGTYVAPSYATNPNSTKLDNYSTQGNVNPYSGRVGTVDPYRVPSTPSYSAPSPYRSQCGYTSSGTYVCR